MSGGFATIGHSNRTVEAVLEMLQEAGVRLLVDVRSFPRSRSNPAFNHEGFPARLAESQIGYEHMPALGGRRPKQPGADQALNDFWKVQSFHNYADYALGPQFQEALHRLLDMGGEQSLALMCSEAVWWRCHRRIITDYLLLHGREVRHLMAPGRIENAKLTETARLLGDGRVIYPRDLEEAQSSIDG